ncbi:macro domain-containing protein [Stenotrophomonas maltophilia]|nr:macro domain-containing protein [Stenotrophomonas maltophilia]MBH1682751.1 macro domain-containing protein [Stenotrophomonas maltophilia]MBH1876040.1 macro domain-containing protein [Stenotrophomonas maltophilia]
MLYLMAIKFENGDLFQSGAEALVNTVNCVGVMGKGVALEFKRRWPENFKFYKRHCETKWLRPGRVLVFDRGGMFGNDGVRYLFNFPTKDHWRSKSKLDFIDKGLDSMMEEIERLSIRSIALPPLGCGNGGLEWDEVRPLIVEKVSIMSNVDFHIFGPSASQVATPEFREGGAFMSPSRAIFLKALANLEPAFGGAIDRLSLQKVAYFLQVLGVRLNLSYEDSLYGPYSEALKKSLFSMAKNGQISSTESDGRFFTVTPSGFAASEEFIQANIAIAGDADAVVANLAHLLEGFKSPYGLELLSTIHWYSSRLGPQGESEIVDSVHSLGAYRRNSFPKSEIQLALSRIVEDGLVRIHDK